MYASAVYHNEHIDTLRSLNALYHDIDSIRLLHFAIFMKPLEESFGLYLRYRQSYLRIYLY